MSEWKDDVFKAAMKVMQNPAAQKVMTNEKFQKAVGSAFKASFKVKSQIDEKKEGFARMLNLSTTDDLRSIKREVDRLQRQVARLKRENESLQKENEDS